MSIRKKSNLRERKKINSEMTNSLNVHTQWKDKKSIHKNGEGMKCYRKDEQHGLRFTVKLNKKCEQDYKKLERKKKKYIVAISSKCHH